MAQILFKIVGFDSSREPQRVRRSFELPVDATQGVRGSTDVRMQSEGRVRGYTHEGPLNEIKEVKSESRNSEERCWKERSTGMRWPAYSRIVTTVPRLPYETRFVIRGPGPRLSGMFFLTRVHLRIHLVWAKWD